MDAWRLAPPPVAQRLVGRRPALAALTSAVDDAVAGHGGLVLVTGDPGIGKTALAAAAAAHAGARGACVAWGTCWDGEGAPGFWPWIQVLRELGLPPGVFDGRGGDTPLDEHADRFRLFDDVGLLLVRTARERPLVVVLDDLHWADASSVRLLTFLARQLRAAPVLVVGTYRDVEVAAADHPLHELLPVVVEQARVLPVPGLDPAESAALLRARAGCDVPGHLAAELHRRTGGNPFFVEQLAQLAEPAGDVPPVVGDVVARRLDRLSDDARRLLDAAAVVGTAFDPGLAAAAAGLDAGTALAGMHEAGGARIVSRDGAGGARFLHDLFREVLVARMPPDRRCRLHLAVAEQLEARRDAGNPGPPSEPAHHRAAALPLGDRDRAVAALLAAARDATARRAFDEAASWYARATDVVGAPAPALLVEHASALRRAGRPGAAYDRFLTAARKARTEGDTAALAGAALGVHRVATRTDVLHADVIALLEEALAGDPAPVDRCLLLAGLARELSDGLARDEPRADALASEAVRAARALGDTAVLAHALWAQLDVRWRPGTARERLPMTDELEAVARAAGETELVLEARLTRTVALLELGDPAWSTTLDEFSQLADESRVPHWRFLALSRRASRACLTGPVPVAEALVDEAVAYGEEVGEPDAWAVGSSQWIGLALLQGDWARILALIEGRSRQLAPPGFTPVFSAYLHVERGETAAAAALLSGMDPFDDLAYRWRRTATFTMLAELAAAVGDRALCARLSGELAAAGDTIGVLGGAVLTTGPVALQLGLAAAALGRWSDAVMHLEHAVAVAERVAAPMLAVRCRLELAAVLAAGGEVDRARPLLTGVLADAGALGMDRLAARAERLLADLERPAADVFRREGDVWMLTYAGRTVRLRDAKGLRDLARLLAAPGEEIAAAELLGLPAPPPGADPVLDDAARAAYRRRIAELDEQLAAADATGDAERSARLAAERAAVVRELTRASGLGGRRRRLGDEAERARTTVTARIRDSLRHVEQVHPELGAHLRASVVTGTRCAYRPADAVRWSVQDASHGTVPPDPGPVSHDAGTGPAAR